jgi:hypothetical protein
MKSQVFQFVLFYNPEVDKDSVKRPSIVESGMVIAPNAEKAKLLASRKIPVNMEAEISDIEVLVRPF